MNSFVKSHDLMRVQIGSHANEKLLIHSRTVENAVKNTCKQSCKIKPDQQ